MNLYRIEEQKADPSKCRAMMVYRKETIHSLT